MSLHAPQTGHYALSGRILLAQMLQDVLRLPRFQIRACSSEDAARITTVWRGQSQASSKLEVARACQVILAFPWVCCPLQV